MQLKHSWHIPGIPSFVIPQLSKIIHKLMRHSVTAGQRKVQFCTLLQLSIKLCAGSRNMNRFTASLHLH
jgi:hypothetical protein